MNILEAIKEMEKGKIVKHGSSLFRMRMISWANGSEPEFRLYKTSKTGSLEGKSFLFLDEIQSNEWEVTDLDSI